MSRQRGNRTAFATHRAGKVSQTEAKHGQWQQGCLGHGVVVDHNGTVLQLGVAVMQSVRHYVAFASVTFEVRVLLAGLRHFVQEGLVADDVGSQTLLVEQRQDAVVVLMGEGKRNKRSE